MRVVAGRFRVGRLDDVLAEMGSVVAEARLRWRVRVFVTWAVQLVWVALALSLPMLLGLWVVCFMFTLFFGLHRRAALPRKQAKFEFTQSLLRALADDLHPLAKHAVTFDARHYDEASKRITPPGRPKAKFTDKWLDLDVALADGTRLRVRCQAGVKEKRGRLVSEKRRLFVAFAPDPRRYDVLAMGRDVAQLRKRLKVAGLETTGAVGERFHVHLDARDDGIRVRVTQMDAPISVAEVLRLVEVIVGYLAEHPRRRAA